MIKVETLEDDLHLMKYYYENGWSWIFANTFEEYKIKQISKSFFKPYYVWDLESLEKYHHKFNSNGKKYIVQNDMWKITSKEYLNLIREKKLERILK